MNQPVSDTPSDCYSDAAELLPAAEASRRIGAQVTPISGRETVGLQDALGRVLADDVRSRFDVPGHTNSAMDGFAMNGHELPDSGTRAFNVLGTAWAGKPFQGKLSCGDAVRIMTGAALPQGADTVVMAEHVEEHDGTALIGAGHTPGQHVRQAGEDIAKGAVALRAGKRLGPAELGLLASLGTAEITVLRRVRVAYFSTGDEIRPPGESIQPGQVYDSNHYTVHGMLARLGVEIIDMGVVRDQRDAVCEALSASAQVADTVISSGGASAGEADFIKEALDSLGQVGFWRIAIRPGRPLAFGHVGGAMYFGLPGNPVAVMVTFYQFVQPALRRLMGESDPQPGPTVQVTCLSRLRKKPGRVEYYRARLEREADGHTVVRSTGKPGSALLHTMSDANCFIVLPEDGESVEPGAEVEVQPFFGLM